MKFLFAPDSFKGSLTALEITKLLTQAAKKVFPNVEICALPVADGGEGTVESLVEAMHGTYCSMVVTGPMGTPVKAQYGLIDGRATAVIEMAQAAGLPLIPIHGRNPMLASSIGVGEMILKAIAGGAKKLLVGIGGSATNDGGMGMLCALGARFFDVEGKQLSGNGENLAKVASVDLSQIDKRIYETEMVVICDVTNPLLGENGATYIYGPQKGATPAMCQALEQGMGNYAKLLSAALGCDVASFAGAGAAGGLGAALGGVLKAQLKPGITAVMEAARFDELVQDCDLVITGEGRIDGQSVRFGKVPVGIAKRCAALSIPVIAITGGMGDGAEGFYALGKTSIQTTVNAVMPLEKALRNARQLLLDAAERMFRMIQIGQELKEE